MFDSRSGAARRGGVHRFWRTLATIALTAGLVGLVGLDGCGDDDDGGGLSTTHAEQFEESLAGLVGFGTDALTSPEALVLQHAVLSALLNELGMSLPLDGGLQELALAPGDLVSTRRTVMGMAPDLRSSLAVAQPDTFYGTYVRDRLDMTEPFPGWVIDTPDEPANGLVFQFPADAQDITVVDPESGAVIPVAGVISFLDIEPDIVSNPGEPITSMTFELELGLGGPPLTTAARITYDVTYVTEPGSVPELTSARIGDVNDVAGDSFIGTTAFALSIDANPDPPYINPELQVILLDTSTDPDYAINWSLAADDFDVETGMPQAVSTSFAYGPTSDPTSPPWALNVGLTNFRQDPTNPDDFDADVSGSMTANGTPVATFLGDTTEVQVAADVNGDGNIDENDTCINIDITIDGRTGNLCEVFIDIASTLPAGGIGLLFAGPYCPCASD